jgi:structural maintenance of chromosome 4
MIEEVSKLHNPSTCLTPNQLTSSSSFTVIQANKKLDEVNEQRLEKVQRLKTAERERDNLLDSKTEVELFLAKERDIRLKKNALYQLFLSMEKKNEDKIVSRQTEIVQKLAYEKEKMKTIESNMVGIEKDYEAVKKQYDGLEKDLQNATTVSYQPL